MQKRLPAALRLLLICWPSLALTEEAPWSQAAWPGETVTLPCGLPRGHEIAWLAQWPDSGALSLRLLAKAHGRAFVYLGRPDPRLSLVPAGPGNSSGLRIEGVAERDGGLYYCGVRERGTLLFGRGTRLRVGDDDDDDDGGDEGGPPAVSLPRPALLGLVAGSCLLLLLVCVFAIALFVTVRGRRGAAGGGGSREGLAEPEKSGLPPYGNLDRDLAA